VPADVVVVLRPYTYISSILAGQKNEPATNCAYNPDGVNKPCDVCGGHGVIIFDYGYVGITLCRGCKLLRHQVTPIATNLMVVLNRMHMAREVLPGMRAFAAQSFRRLLICNRIVRGAPAPMKCCAICFGAWPCVYSYHIHICGTCDRAAWARVEAFVNKLCIGAHAIAITLPHDLHKCVRGMLLVVSNDTI